MAPGPTTGPTGTGRRALVGVLGAAAGFVVGGLTIWLTNGASPRDLDSIRWWSLLAAAGVVAVTIHPMLGWIDAAVADLLATPEVAVPLLVDTTLADGVGLQPGELAGTLAASVARVLAVPYVLIELAPIGGHVTGAWAQRSKATIGEASKAGIVHHQPLRFDGVTVGTLSVGGRRPGRSLSSADAAAVEALAQTLALVVSSARASEQQHAALQQIVVAREDERRRLRRELHDGLGPTLSALKLQVAALRRSESDDTVRASVVEGLSESLAEASADVRRLVDGLRPPMLDDLGLVAALRALPFVPPTLHVEVSSEPAIIELPAATEVALYRIVAEAVHNIVRHAEAQVCTIDLSIDAGVVAVTITDDGRGIAGSAPGVGMRSMRERAHELGGLVTIAPAPGRGTSVMAVFPATDAVRPNPQNAEV